MVFFVANDGTIVKSFPEPVYQGSVGANEISIVSPLSPSYSVTAAFTLPNGVNIGPFPMTSQGEIPGLVSKATGQPYSGWRLQNEAEFTRLFGVVSVQFYFYAPSGPLVATSSTSFSVGRGVPAQLPSVPSAYSWSKILAAISAIQSDLQNGYFAARSLLPWNNGYTYGANEFVWYPNKGIYGMLLKSLAEANNNPPYIDGVLNARYWQEVLDFSIIESLYDLNDVLAKARAAQEAAETAQQAAEKAEQSVMEVSDSLLASVQAAEEAAQKAADSAGLANSAVEEVFNVANQASDNAMKALTDSVYVKNLAVNQPNSEAAGNVGTPRVIIELAPDGTPRFKFENLKGEKGDKGQDGYNLPVNTGFFRMEVRADGHLYLVSPDIETSPMRINAEGHLILTI